ncbi:glycosyltransferase family 4 protein [Alcanivorax sp. P2S70]|uniref:glycosyltransferase family 4 protein n=1 Tax=Alcanivorax sp. P2S70 TaxID=1397527 RepID=UPI0004CFD0E5|nr:glycosyltransferase family 4 protein [Alcanivorax sp. P2S70]
MNSAVMTGTDKAALKVLAVHRYYWPDTPPYASMLKQIVGQWVKDGHDVDVLSSQPSYKSAVENSRQAARETIDGAQVIRLKLPHESGRPIVRILNALRLGVGVIFQAVIRKRYDVLMVSTAPPVLAGWFVALAAKLSGARFIYHCMDIHPEIGRISGEFRNPRVFNLLSRMDSWSCSQARPVVLLSSDMADSLVARGAESQLQTRVINNFSLPSDALEAGDLPFTWPDEPFVLLFAGNIGRFQGLDILMDAMELLRGRGDIRLLMMGEGVERNSLERIAEEKGLSVTFVGHHSVEVAKQAMKRAQAGFVSLIPELYRFAYPSKTMTYLEQGCPVIVAVEPESQLAKDITDNGAGLSVPGGNAEKLADAIGRLASNTADLMAMRSRAESLANHSFTEQVVLKKWSALLVENQK